MRAKKVFVNLAFLWRCEGKRLTVAATAASVERQIYTELLVLASALPSQSYSSGLAFVPACCICVLLLRAKRDGV